jgi:hypothetical protein
LNNFQGCSIKNFVTYLKVKQHEVRKKAVFEMITENVCSHIAGGIESIAGVRGNYWVRLKHSLSKRMKHFFAVPNDD